MIETFIHEEYVNKRREQRRQQHQHQQRRRRQMRALQMETDKGTKLIKLPATTAAAEGQHSSRDHHQPAAAAAYNRSPVGSPTADTTSFRDHLFDYLKPY
jgi:transcription initiation factor TFIID subunit TAF12